MSSIPQLSDVFSLFVQFQATYADWKLWQEFDDTYVVGYRMYSADDTVGFNPDTAIGSYGQAPNVTKRFLAGAYAPFRLSCIRNVTFDGKLLVFEVQGQTIICDGTKGTISVR